LNNQTLQLTLSRNVKKLELSVFNIPLIINRMCQIYADVAILCTVYWRPQLRSAHANILTVPRTITWLDNRSFSVAGPRICNSLPASLRQPDIEFGHFKRLLTALVTLWFQCAVYKSIYLLIYYDYSMTQCFQWFNPVSEVMW